MSGWTLYLRLNLSSSPLREIEESRPKPRPRRRRRRRPTSRGRTSTVAKKSVTRPGNFFPLFVFVCFVTDAAGVVGVAGVVSVVDHIPVGQQHPQFMSGNGLTYCKSCVVLMTKLKSIDVHKISWEVSNYFYNNIVSIQQCLPSCLKLALGSGLSFPYIAEM